jgi:phosphate transport system substrate-binding protein
MLDYTREDPMQRYRKTAASVLIGLALAAASSGMLDTAAQPRQAAKLEGKLTLTGSSTMSPLIEDIGKRFQARHPGVRIEVRRGGSGAGIADARSGAADIGMVSRALGEKEKDLRGYPIGRDGIAVLVHKSNVVRNLSVDQLRAIFTGRITDWKDVGGKRHAIVFIGRSQGRGSTEVVTHYLKLGDDELKPQRRIGDNVELLAAIAGEPQGIAYNSVGSAERAMHDGAPIYLLRAGGVEPSVANILTGDYPVARPLTLVTRQAPVGLARAFIEYALSPPVADLLRTHDFIPYED